MSFENGSVIGDYQIIGPLGQGGMGRVYRVRNLISNREEAMKVLLPKLADESEVANRFLQEVRLVAGLTHPNIPALHTALRYENQLLMIMQLVDGPSLENCLHEGPLGLAESAACCYQTLSALSYAHAQGVVHCDIKPTNVLLETKTGRWQLLDFGIATKRGDGGKIPANVMLGTLRYMSPERIEGEIPTEKADIYSTGAMLYRMVTGIEAFDGENEFEIMRAQLNHVPIPPKNINSEVPSALSEAILCSLEKRPENRFSSAAQFQTALEPFANGENLGPVDSSPAESVNPESKPLKTKLVSPIAKALARKLAHEKGNCPATNCGPNGKSSDQDATVAFPADGLRDLPASTTSEQQPTAAKPTSAANNFKRVIAQCLFRETIQKKQVLARPKH